MATKPPEGWSTGPAGIQLGQGEVGTVDVPWYLQGTGPATYTAGEGQDQTTGILGPETIPQDVAWRQVAPNKYQTQRFDDTGLIDKPLDVDLTDPNEWIAQLIIGAGMAGVLGPLAGNLGAAVAPGLSTTAQMAIGQGLVNAGKTFGLGGNLGDIAKAGVLGGATSYATSAIGDILPKNVANTGITSLDTALNKGIQSAAGSGVTSLLTGNKNALQDALMAGASAAAGSGANSAMESTFGNTGLPAPAANILSSAALAAVMGKDPGKYALKSALGEITGAIKGSAPSGNSGATGSTGARGLANLNEEYDDNSSLFSNSKGELASLDTSGQRYVPGSNPLLPQNVAAAQNAAAEQEQLLAFANQANGQFGLTPQQEEALNAYTKDLINLGLTKDSAAGITSVPDEIQALIQAGLTPDYAAAVAGPEGIEALAKDFPPESFNQTPSGAAPSTSLAEDNLFDLGENFGTFAERPETSADTDAAPQQVDITGHNFDLELMRFLEANGLTADEAQKVLITGKDKTAGTDYNSFYETPGSSLTPKVVVQGQTPPKDTAVDDLMAMLNQYDPQLDNAQRVEITGKASPIDELAALLSPNDTTQRVDITGTAPKTLPIDSDLNLDRYYPGDTQTEAPSTSDKLTDDLLQKVEITGKIPPIDELLALLNPSDTTQRVDITGTTPLDYSSLEYPLGPEDETPKVVIEGKTPPIPFVDYSDLNNIPTEIEDETPQVVIEGKTPPIPFFDYSVLDNIPTETEDGTPQVVIKGQTPPTPFIDYSDLDNIPKEELIPDAQQVVIRDKLVDEPPFDGHVMPPVEQPVQVPVAPDKPIVDPIRPPIKPIVDPIRPIIKPIVDPKVTTTSGGNITIPGMTQQLHQELMQLPDFDLEKLLSPSLYAYHQAQKRKQTSQEDQMAALLNQLGYRS